MAWGAVAGLVLGAAQSISQTNSYIKQLGYETEAKISAINASKENFAAEMDALVVQNYLNENSAANAMSEVARAGGANIREAQVQIKEGMGKISASSEGITAGISKARELGSYIVKSSKALGGLQEQTRKGIIDIADRLDAATNEIAMKREQSYNNMLLAISNVSPYSSIQTPSASGMLTNMFSGAQLGKQFESNLGDIFATNTTTTID
jgi:hypothetical protein